jgi:glyoxylase-like metal-dependent hydrolase (beta-lactamase superfamily II)
MSPLGTAVHEIPHTGFARAYLIEGDRGFAAVDVGSRGSALDVSDHLIRVLGSSPERLHVITATHFHIDHIGGIGFLLRTCPPETKVLFPGPVREYLDGTKRMSVMRNWFVGLAPATLLCSRSLRRAAHLRVMTLAGIPLPGFRRLVRLPYRDRVRFPRGAGRRVPMGFGEWEIIETPGHSSDSVSFYNGKTRELICGDLILNVLRKKGAVLNRFYWDRERLEDSFQYLLENTKPLRIYPGHGAVIKDEENALLRVSGFRTAVGGRFGRGR